MWKPPFKTIEGQRINGSDSWGTSYTKFCDYVMRKPPSKSVEDKIIKINKFDSWTTSKNPQPLRILMNPEKEYRPRKNYLFFENLLEVQSICVLIAIRFCGLSDESQTSAMSIELFFVNFHEPCHLKHTYAFLGAHYPLMWVGPRQGLIYVCFLSYNRSTYNTSIDAWATRTCLYTN
jgi:hypothetical protein